jgi:hypothetical protein
VLAAGAADASDVADADTEIFIIARQLKAPAHKRVSKKNFFNLVGSVFMRSPFKIRQLVWGDEKGASCITRICRRRQNVTGKTFKANFRAS